MNDGYLERLERQALATAANARAKAEALREAEERKREAEERLRRAEEEDKARRGAARRLRQVLGHKTSPGDWGISRGNTYSHGRRSWHRIGTFATLKLLGVDIRGNESCLEVDRYSGGGPKHHGPYWEDLTLVSFGQALERREQDS